ncbi:SpoIIE family protein phosphatase [Bdellovibrio bacteriovorus]
MSDKKSYLYSTALDRVETESSKLQKDFQSSFDKIRIALLFFNPTTYAFNPQFKEVAVKQNWGRILLFRNVEGSLQSMDSIGNDFSLGPNLQKKLLALQDQQVLTSADLRKPDSLQVFFRQGEFYIYGELQLPYLKEALQNPQLGFYSLTETQWHFPAVHSALAPYSSEFSSIFDQKSGVKETKLGSRYYLISFKFIPQINSYVFQIFDKAQVFAVVERTMNKTLLVSIIILAIGLIAMFLGVDSLTQNLSKLASGMSTFTKSGTARPLKLHSRDEVGKMAEVYNSMLAKIESLLAQSAEKARMESELETAKEVQSTLLPKNKVEHELYNVKGFYKPASECGGDLWYYYCDDKKIFLFVGDATGHGVPAALITAAARSVLSLSVDENIWDPARILGMLNKVLCDVAKGEKMMTAFACVYDIDKKELTYSNASHDVPFVVPVVESGVKIKKGDLNFLTEANGKRLGHERSYEYKNESIIFSSGQNLLVYTDGLVDAVDKEAKAFSERGIIKMAVDSANRNSQRSLHDQIAKRISEYTEGIEQPDDITFVNIYLK